MHDRPKAAPDTPIGKEYDRDGRIYHSVILMAGFSEANVVEREVKAEDDKWKAQLKELQDSLRATVDHVFGMRKIE